MKVIHTDDAPAAIGTYSQAVVAGNTVYISGQVPFDPKTMNFVDGDFSEHVRQVFRNLSAVATAAGGSLGKIAKLSVYLLTMDNFAAVNAVMEEFFQAPFPARAAIAVKELPKGAAVEMDAIMVLD